MWQQRSLYCDAGCGVGVSFDLEEVKRAWKVSLSKDCRQNHSEEPEELEPGSIAEEEEENIHYLLQDWIKGKYCKGFLFFDYFTVCQFN